MATLNDSLVSSSSRRLPIRVRPDLTARRQRYQGRNYWVVKEPIGLQYFRFEEEEFAILQMLDGESSLDEISERFEADFPPQTIRLEELQQFIGMLHRSGLVITTASGQGIQLKKRRDEKKRRERLAAMTNVLAIRFKGFDPERALTAIYPYVRWFFTVPALIICCILAVSALTLVIVQFDVFRSRLPSFEAFFAAKNWLWLGITLAVTKIIHEFGHGLSCKHFGGECHEMGVMFLVLTPCLYCNVSDSWMLPNRWHRAAIGAAGMYVEVVIASICTFIWWFTEPGPLNFLCLNVMFISSVSTILFNANPLLRYDGYYIVSDLLEIPNLRQKSSAILNRKLGKWCLGLEEPEDPFLPKRNQTMFALYTVAAAIYRWVVVLSILFFLNKVFEPYGLKIVGQIIALAALYGLVVQPLVKVYKFFKVPGRLGKVKRVRMYSTLAILAVFLAAIIYIPLPASVWCSLEVQPRDAAQVYVEVDGRLDQVHVEPGDHVEQGALLATLSNIDLELELTRLTGLRDQYEAQLNSLSGRRTHDLDVNHEALPLEELLESTKRQLEQRQQDLQRLELVAPQAGTVIPPPRQPDPPSDEAELPNWSGSPLEKENLGALLAQSQLFCQIGNPDDLEAVLVIDQADIEFVDREQPVRIMLDQSTRRVYVSKIADISVEDLKVAPTRQMGQAGGELPTQQDASGAARLLNTSYQATVPIEQDGLLRVGLVGQARVQIRHRTIGDRVWRYLTRTFNFEL